MYILCRPGHDIAQTRHSLLAVKVEHSRGSVWSRGHCNLCGDACDHYLRYCTISMTKVLSTPANQSVGVLRGIGRRSEEGGIDYDALGKVRAQAEKDLPQLKPPSLDPTGRAGSLHHLRCVGETVDPFSVPPGLPAHANHHHHHHRGDRGDHRRLHLRGHLPVPPDRAILV